VSADEERNLSNLDRWYERDRGERIGNYTLYRVSLRDRDAGLNAQTPQSNTLR
jgi:hypothetical protein